MKIQSLDRALAIYLMLKDYVPVNGFEKLITDKLCAEAKEFLWKYVRREVQNEIMEEGKI